jgi:hypothetical protein
MNEYSIVFNNQQGLVRREDLLMFDVGPVGCVALPPTGPATGPVGIGEWLLVGMLLPPKGQHPVTDNYSPMPMGKRSYKWMTVRHQTLTMTLGIPVLRRLRSTAGMDTRFPLA